MGSGIVSFFQKAVAEGRVVCQFTCSFPGDREGKTALNVQESSFWRPQQHWYQSGFSAGWLPPKAEQ